MKKLISVVILAGLLFAGASLIGTSNSNSALSVNTAYAQSSDSEEGLVPCTLTECTFCKLLEMVERIISWMLKVAFAIAILFVILNGFLYIVSIGDEGLMASAKEGLKFSIIGFAICLLSWLAIHVLYKVMGYTGDSWWTVECTQSTSEIERENRLVLLAANETAPTRLGGRDKPASLSDLVMGKIEKIPADKYFFVHGIGGQPISIAAQKLAELVKTAKNEGKTIYTVIPQEGLGGEIEGGKAINLNNLLGSTTDISSKEAKDKFMDLAVMLLSKNVGELSTFNLVSEGEKLKEFSGIWPEYDWSAVSKKVEPTTTVSSKGLVYEEGNGPLLFNPYKFDIPNDQTHININLRGDGSLDKDDPIEVMNVAEGVSEEQLNEFIQQVYDLIFRLSEQLEVKGEEEMLILELIKQLSKKERDELNRLKKKSEDRKVLEEEYLEEDVDEETLAGSGDFDPEKDREGTTGGTGTLPSKIKSSSGGSKQGTGSGSMDTGGLGNMDTGTGSCSTCGTGNNTGGGKINESITSIGAGGDLTEAEKRNLYENIIPRALKEMGLDVDPKLIMCLIKQESTFNTGITSHSNAKGLTQIIPGTAPIAQRDFKKYSERHKRKTGEETVYHIYRNKGVTDSMMRSPQALYSKLDREGKKGELSTNLGIAYLRDVKDTLKLNLKTRAGIYTLLNGYYRGPGNATSARTGYSGTITHCLDTPGMRHLIYPGRSEKKK